MAHRLDRQTVRNVFDIHRRRNPSSILLRMCSHAGIAQASNPERNSLSACYSWFVAVDSFSALQRSVFMSGRGFSYFAETPGLPLSLKCMFNGRALYRFGRNEV